MTSGMRSNGREVGETRRKPRLRGRERAHDELVLSHAKDGPEGKHERERCKDEEGF